MDSTNKPKVTITLKGESLNDASELSKLMHKDGEKPVGVTQVVKRSLKAMRALMTQQTDES